MRHRDLDAAADSGGRAAGAGLGANGAFEAVDLEIGE